VTAAPSPGPASPTVPPSVGTWVSSLGGAFMISRYAKAAADEQGFAGIWTSYFAGRAGLLGPVDADVVAAVIAFYPPEVVRAGWEAALETVPDIRAAGERYATACHEWGRARLDGADGLGRLADLALTVARQADVTGLPLFAAWRALPLPADDPARVAHALELLREHRGGLHVAAVLASGLTPLQAILAGPGGEANATFFGWTGPFEDPAPYRDLRAKVEQATEAAASRAYEVLDDAELAELADGLEMVGAHLARRATLGRS
jgi:hypothetical protein